MNYDVGMEANNKMKLHRTASCRMSNEVYEEYAKLARQDRRKLSEVLRFALEDHLVVMKRRARRANGKAVRLSL